ncbi:TonB-dependent receptor plug domain-containing protein [Niabella ginsengisoli]|uniref:TonB-dependent receptor plug domain-containing protein n=1 Tax=Niabella ginsengisoli TaxID=522298 RepID=A0ABS9SGX0_9BACT|nr:TonB-dependent receptor plug domain-containing protein [Niabella ginsengisoli]MCH5597616.1 TonB-dependent receptor plug domain-containing protein [Niabella ginsengisoli]
MKKTMQKMLLALLMSCASFLSWAQQRTVTGAVTDDQGVPLSGVSYIVKGTSTGGITDEKGNFSVSVTSNDAVIEFTFVGYITQSLTVGESATLSITLLKGENQMEGVVVTALGIKRQQKSLGYAVTKISTDKLENIGSPINTFTALYGQVPGLQVNTTAMGPAGGINIKIRNAVALQQGTNTRPLIVIDGIPMLDGNIDNLDRSTGNGLNDLNIDNIESFEVLKGAKASVMYGAKGGSGVILITTKSGTKKPGLGVDLNISSSVDEVWVQQEFQNEFGRDSRPHGTIRVSKTRTVFICVTARKPITQANLIILDQGLTVE